MLWGEALDPFLTFPFSRCQSRKNYGESWPEWEVRKGGGHGRRALRGAVSSVDEGFSSLMLSFDSEGSLLMREISRAAGLQVIRRAERTGTRVLGA